MPFQDIIAFCFNDAMLLHLLSLDFIYDGAGNSRIAPVPVIAFRPGFTFFHS